MAYQDPFVPDSSLRIESLENNGVWARGGTYTVTWYYHFWLKTFADEFPSYYVYKIAPICKAGQASGSRIALIENPIFSTYSNADLYIKGVDSNHSPEGTEGFWGLITPTLLDFADYTVLSMNTDITHSFSRGSDLGGTSGSDVYQKFLYTSTFVVAADAVLGEYVLGYMGFKRDININPSELSEQQRVYYPIKIVGTGGSAPATYPETRRDNYDPDQYFVEFENKFTSDPADLTTLGGGRYGKQLVVLSDQGKLYFGAL